jgi:hypothetical protein
LARKPPKLNDVKKVRISRIFKESRDILGAYLGFLQNHSWQRWLFVFLAPFVLETAFEFNLKVSHVLILLKYSWPKIPSVRNTRLWPPASWMFGSCSEIVVTRTKFLKKIVFKRSAKDSAKDLQICRIFLYFGPVSHCMWTHLNIVQEIIKITVIPSASLDYEMCLFIWIMYQCNFSS